MNEQRVTTLPSKDAAQAKTTTYAKKPRANFGSRQTEGSDFLVPRPNIRESPKTMFCRILVFLRHSGGLHLHHTRSGLRMDVDYLSDV